MHEPDRKKSSSPPEESEDEEYELEAPDEEAEERRRKAILASIEPTIDINEIYREADRDRGSEILQGWVKNSRGFRFQVKHLLIATAVLAIVLTLGRFEMFWTAAVVLFMLAVAGLYVYLTVEEQKQQAEANRQREAAYARRRAQLAARNAGPVIDQAHAPPQAATRDTGQTELAPEEAAAKETFRFQFSLRELILTMTTAAVLLGLIRILGGPAATATLLGIIALVGLFIYAMGFEPPQIVVLGWWLTLVLYVVVTIVAAVWGSFA
jgi:hypothetical protein